MGKDCEESTMVQTYIGASIRRKEDVRFLTGKANFVDDIKVPNMLHAAILRSPHAHARIRSIDSTRALAVPGVVAVITFEDIASVAKRIPFRMYPIEGLDRFLQYPLPQDKVRHVGEAIAVVVGESRYVAEDGVDAIDVDYEPLPAVTDLRDSLSGRVILHEETGTNLAMTYTITIGDVDEAFRTAEYTRKEEFRSHRHTGNPLETRGLVASYDAGRGELTVWGPTKVPHFNREVLSSILQMPEYKIHFIEPDVGGGFGIRGEFYPEDFLIPFAAMKVDRPVKWIEDRLEHLVSANHSRDVLCEVEIGTKRDGTILGLRANIYGDNGAYVRTHGGIVPSSTAALLTGPYDIKAYQATVNLVVTNKMAVGTYRAPGRYESCFFRERLLDMVAADLNLDPIELRLKNLIQPSQMPYHAGDRRPEGPETVFDSGDYPKALKSALDSIEYDRISDLQGAKVDGRYHGIGVACFVKNSGIGPYEGARVVIRGANEIAVFLGISTLGQGHETAMAQICADSLSVPMDSITIFHGNTDFMPFGGGTFGSRGTVMAGNAIYLACQELKEKIVSLAARYLGLEADLLVFSNAHVHRKGSEAADPLIGLEEVVKLASPASSYSGPDPGLDVTAYYKSDELPYSYGTHAAHVAVDPETGKLEILRYVVTEDVGRVINPMMVHGQTVGAAAQGIGASILEELVYDTDGQLLAGTFMDYLLPSSREVPNIESIILEDAPSPLNPLGVKGAGEGGIVASGAALANAVSHALGVDVKALPLSPDRLRELLRNKASR